MSQSPSTEFTGNFEVVRLSASLLDHREGDCGDFAAVKARPQLWSRVSEKRRYAPWETFPLGLVMDVLDAVEFEAAQVDEALTRTLANTRSTVHPGVASWVWHACHTYLEVSESLAATLASEGVELHPERNPRIVQGGRSAAEMRSLTVWGRWYGSPDGTTVEFRRMRLRRPWAVRTGRPPRRWRMWRPWADRWRTRRSCIAPSPSRCDPFPCRNGCEWSRSD